MCQCKSAMSAQDRGDVTNQSGRQLTNTFDIEGRTYYVYGAWDRDIPDDQYYFWVVYNDKSEHMNKRTFNKPPDEHAIRNLMQIEMTEEENAAH